MHKHMHTLSFKLSHSLRSHFVWPHASSNANRMVLPYKAAAAAATTDAQDLVDTSEIDKHEKKALRSCHVYMCECDWRTTRRVHNTRDSTKQHTKFLFILSN